MLKEILENLNEKKHSFVVSYDGDFGSLDDYLEKIKIFAKKNNTRIEPTVLKTNGIYRIEFFLDGDVDLVKKEILKPVKVKEK